jgi:hypothetical protein
MVLNESSATECGGIGMKRMVLALLVGGLVLVTGTIRAQGPDLPPVLDPRDVFTEAVEVVETLPILNVDNAARLAYYFDPSTNAWAAYPYPDGLLATKSFEARGDGTYLLGAPYVSAFSMPDEAWIFDPARGTFSHPQEACGQIQALAGEGKWRLYQFPGDGLWHLCFTETGEMLPPLPGDMQPDVGFSPDYRTSISPSGDWIVFVVGGFAIYAYEVVSGSVHDLGALENYSGFYGGISVPRWADNTHPIIQGVIYHYNPEFYTYVADVTLPGSMRGIADGAPGIVTYFDDPPRYEWVPGEHRLNSSVAEKSGSDQCRIHAFFLETLEETVYPEIPNVCGLGTIVPDGSGDRLYRSVRELGTGTYTYTATLIRFNPETGQSSGLLTGPLVWLDDITADGHYAILLMGSSVPYVSTYMNDLSLIIDQVPSPYLAIFDLSANRVEYEAQGTWTTEDYFGSIVEWAMDDTFLLTDNTRRESRLIRLGDYTVVETPTGYRFDKPNGYRVLVWEGTPGSAQGVGLRDARTGVEVSIIKPVIGEQRLVRLEWQGSDTLRVQVVDQRRSQDVVYPFVLGSWLVRVP